MTVSYTKTQLKTHIEGVILYGMQKGVESEKIVKCVFDLFDIYLKPLDDWITSDGELDSIIGIVEKVLS